MPIASTRAMYTSNSKNHFLGSGHTMSKIMATLTFTSASPVAKLHFCKSKQEHELDMAACEHENHNCEFHKVVFKLL